MVRLLGFIRLIIALVRRIQLTSCASHRQLFVDLSSLLISGQDGRLPFGAEELLAPYRGLIKRYTAALSKDREAQPGSRGVFRALPLGCRVGKLHFSPLLQLAKWMNDPSVAAVMFEPLPQTRLDIHALLLARIGLRGHDAAPATFATVLGFRLADYADYLVRIRREDPVLFTMLLANEFRYAREWVSADRDEDHRWIKHGATLAELERLVEIVSFTRTNPLRLSALLAALPILAKGLASRQYQANLQRHRQLLPYLEQLSYSTEGLRALFLGDTGGPLIAPAADWSRVTTEMRFKAAARCAWFAANQAVVLPGFRIFSLRLVRGRRHAAYTYYGVPLDHLLSVGLKDLATALDRPGGVNACDELASTIDQAVFGSKRSSLDNQARQAAVYAEIYLREQGHGGSSNRFDPRYWFNTARDEALYSRLWSLFVTPANKKSDGSVRYQIRSAVAVLRQLLAPFWRGQMPTDPTAARRILAQLACGLTPLSMDPIFAALLERALVERQVPEKFRTDPSRAAAKHGGRHLEAYLMRLLDPEFRPAYARFAGVDGRQNHDPKVSPAGSLVRTKTLPVALRAVATSTRR